MAEFSLEAWKLGPGYRCVMCDRTEKDLPRGCPTCSLGSLYAIYQEGIEDEIKRFREGFPAGWSKDRLMHLHGDVSDLLASNRNRISRKWSIAVIAFAEIILQERKQIEYKQSWETWRKSQEKK